MTRIPLLVLAAAVTLLFAANASADEETQPETSLISYEIKDQFDQVHTQAELQGNIVTLFWSDREGSKFNDPWVAAVEDSLKAEAAYGLMKKLEVAHTKGVPFFVKGKVKGKFSKEKEKWVLMDWGGEFNKAYQLESDNCNILVFDSDGQLVHSSFGQELDQTALAGTLKAIRGLMTAAMEGP